MIIAILALEYHIHETIFTPTGSKSHLAASDPKKALCPLSRHHRTVQPSLTVLRILGESRKGDEHSGDISHAET